MKKLLTVMLLLLAGTAWSGDFEDGEAAYSKKNYAVAMVKLKLAAKQGHAIAQSNIGFMYNDGLGVIQDYVRAHMWFNLAAAGGDALAVKGRDMVAAKMTAQQISKAQKLARECQASKFKNCD